MKFIIMTIYDSYIIEADDFEEVVNKSYNNHCGYNNITGITRIPEEE